MAAIFPPFGIAAALAAGGVGGAAIGAPSGMFRQAHGWYGPAYDLAKAVN
jgi:hypothetical protein